MSLFFKADFVSNNSELQQIDGAYSLSAPYSPLGFWDFSGYINNLVSDSGLLAEPTGEVSSVLGGIEVTDKAGNYITLPITDEPSVTIVGSCKVGESSSVEIVGNHQRPSEATSSNWGLLSMAGRLDIFARSNANDLSFSGSIGVDVNARGKDIIYAVSIDKQSRKVFLLVDVDGVEYYAEKYIRESAPYESSGYNISLGSKLYTKNSSGSTLHKSCIVYDKALDKRKAKEVINHLKSL